jgi:ubiquinone/menaquinone biosynthesis C-methylase UbiE
MWQRMIVGQYRRPTGLLGRIIGAQMVRDHEPENLWTVEQLAAQPTDQIVEIGCGAGVAIQALSHIVVRGRIVGVDFSRAMLRAARRRNAAAIKQRRVELHYGDVAALPFADRAFDKAFSIHSIYFWPRPIEALTNIWRVLKPAGTCTLTVLPKERWNEGNPNMPVGTPECTAYTGEDLRYLLGQAGFQQTFIRAHSDSAYRSNYCVVGIK